MSAEGKEIERPKGHKALKRLGKALVIGAVGLCVLIFCAVKFVGSRYLAPLVERVAADYIDGEVKLGDLRLGFRAGFPILSVEVDDLVVISHAFDSLPDAERGLLPGYADSLLSLDHLSGALDVKRLLVDNELSLHDVALRGLSVNLVIDRAGKANYDIIRLPADTSASSASSMPGLRIDRLSLTDPRAIRFYNAADSTSASVLLLTDASVDGGEQPTYRLKVSGNVTSPQATLLTNLEQISFGLDGKVYYDPSHPGLVAMDAMAVQGAFFRAIASGEIDLTASPIVTRGRVQLLPVAVGDLLTMLPDSLRAEYRLYEPYFRTDAAVGAKVELTAPMNLVTDTIPSAKIDISVTPAMLTYGPARLTDLALDMTVTTTTNLPDSTRVEINRFNMAAPGTQLEISGALASLLSDPAFDLGIEGRVDVRDLPPILIEKLPGYLSGVVSANLHAKGRASMFTPQKYHKLMADGRVEARGLYYLTADTSKMVQVGNANITLSSNRSVAGAPRLKTKVSIDTATILVSGVDLALGGVAIDAAVEGSGAPADTTMMKPVGGTLRVGRFNVTSITDSAGARMRNIAGPLKLRALRGRGSVPEIMTELMIGSVSAGTKADRVALVNTSVSVALHKAATTPKRALGRGRRKTALPDHKIMGYIAPSEVYRYVYNKRKHGHHIRRVYGATGTDSDEILVWNLTPQFRRFLAEWQLTGAVRSNKGSLRTPLFPLPTGISGVDLRFNNDTINITDLTVQAGHSDVTMAGRVSNVSRALTSNNHDGLRINLALLCNAIDVNELSAAVFAGASHAAGPGHGSPVLIPVNIDGKMTLDARNVTYSDLSMQSLGGEILVYDGGVNLHNLTARSDAGNLSLSALYSAPRLSDMNFGFGLELSDFDIAKFVKLVPAIDSITPLMHDFSGMVGVDLAATCRIDSGMNIDLPSLNAAVKISGDNLAFIDPDKYRTLGKWLGFKNKADNTIHSLNVEMTIRDGLLRVYPFVFNIDRYRLGVYGSNDIAMNFNYHLSVLKSPIPFKFGITVSGSPKKYKVRFGGAKFKESSVVESREIVSHARINLLDQIEGVFSRGVRNSSFARLKIDSPAPADEGNEIPLSAADSLRLAQEGLLDLPEASVLTPTSD